MSGPQYAPGTHVKATSASGVTLVGYIADDGAFVPDVGLFRWSPAFLTYVRPLVVLDPDDAEQVAYDVWRRWNGNITEGVMVAVVDTLRDLAPKPIPVKPDEPQGLGAVVEYDNTLWTRHGGRWHTDIPNGWTMLWENMSDAVRVLSEGVTA